MLGILGKRLLSLIFTMMAVSVLVFAAFEFTPGQVARKVLGPFATQDQVDQLTERMGLNRPVHERYFEWLGNTLSGDLGTSTLYKTEVNNIIWDRLGNTLLLAAVAFVIIVVFSILLGIAAGMREGSQLDRTISIASIVTTSVPEFASGVFLASIFVIWLGVLPGTSPLESGGEWSIAAQLVLPVAVIVLHDLGYVVCMIRAHPWSR